MTTLLDDYQEQACRTAKDLTKEKMDQYCCMKLAEEVGELSGMIAKHYYHGKEFDKENCLEELGDLIWYIANIAKANGFTMSEIATCNVEKLKKRHGESYNKNYYNGK